MASKDELKDVFVTGAKPTQEDFHNLIDVAGEQGPQGPPGTDGKQGPKGDPGQDGQDGADGFGTKAEYDEIISRLEALENPVEGGE